LRQTARAKSNFVGSAMPVAAIAKSRLRLAAKVSLTAVTKNCAEVKPSVGCDASPGARQIRADLHECGAGRRLIAFATFVATLASIIANEDLQMSYRSR
jgi:hypothetical protein